MEVLKRYSLTFIIMPTYECNLACDYCFSKRRKQRLEQDKINELFIKIKHICEFFHTTNIYFYWIGGEVFLLGHEWFERMFKECKNVFKNDPITKYSIKHNIQSNITLYNKKWKKILHKLIKKHIGSSLDYPNIYRKVKGKTSSDFTKLWFRKRKEMINDGFKVGIISLPNKETLNIGAKKFYDYYFNKNDFKSIKINSPYSVDFQKVEYSLDIKKITEFMINLFKIWWENGKDKGITIRPFQYFIDMMYKPNDPWPCLWSPECGNGFFSIGPYGEIGLCDSLVSNYPELHYGNIFTDKSEDIIFNKNRINYIKRLEAILDSECNDCPYCTICFGGCVTRAYPAKHDVFAKDIYCEMYKELFKIIEYYTRKNRTNLELSRLKNKNKFK